MATTDTITQVIGSTFDTKLPEDQLPAIYNAVRVHIETSSGTSDLTGEVQQHLGGGRIRAVALGSTDGLKRGVACEDTGAPVTVPVGEEVLGRVFNLSGEPVDRIPGPDVKMTMPIHREPPEFSQLNTQTEMLVTGIKVVDMLCPFV